MADSDPATNRDRVRRWMANWQTVSEVKDELTRVAPPPDRAACVDRGLSLIAFAYGVRPSTPEGARARAAGASAVRQTWRRLRAAYGR
ncbi:MAG: hypothetical protein H0X67_20660 [Acidobacteria bacterium]|nr:hypothetical protein [Acidobacteriota bacterium]